MLVSRNFSYVGELLRVFFAIQVLISYDVLVFAFYFSPVGVDLGGRHLDPLSGVVILFLLGVRETLVILRQIQQTVCAQPVCTSKFVKALVYGRPETVAVRLRLLYLKHLVRDVLVKLQLALVGDCVFVEGFQMLYVVQKNVYLLLAFQFLSARKFYFFGCFCHSVIRLFHLQIELLDLLV